MSVENINYENYVEFINRDSAIIVAAKPGCGPCEEYKAIVEHVSKVRDDLKFGVADVMSRNSGLKRDFGTFQTFPTTIFYREGKIVHSVPFKLDTSGLLKSIEDAFEE